MQILVNGEHVTTDVRSLSELCESLGFAGAKIATAVNGCFVAAHARARTALSDADEIEILAPRQGG
ncbi:MAG: sulfur carrier protein ThiS [Pseudomonadota bacterium]